MSALLIFFGILWLGCFISTVVALMYSDYKYYKKFKNSGGNLKNPLLYKHNWIAFSIFGIISPVLIVVSVVSKVKDYLKERRK